MPVEFGSLNSTASSQRRSPTFCSDDADVIFQSSDKVLFYVHRKNLDTSSTGFAPSGIETQGEIVPLTEDSITLELLFSFVYPRHHPDLEMTPFKTLALLAEAAEKYQVFAAMNICKIRMRGVLQTYPSQVLIYAARHGYRSIADEVAPYLLDAPLDEVLMALPPQLGTVWARYRESWTRAIIRAFTYERILARHPADGISKVTVPCDLCQPDLAFAMYRIFKKLGERRSRLSLDVELGSAFSGCRHLNAEDFRPTLGAVLETVPPFESLL